MIVSILIAVFLIANSFIFKKSKFLAIALLGLMWLLWGWNYSNGDYEAYKTLYNNALILEGNYEVGYKLLMIIARLLNLEFQQFIIVISLIVVILWGRFILKCSNVPALYVSCIFLVFFPLDYVLVRNTLAFSIVLQGLCAVIKQNKHSLIKYLLFVLLASSIHFSTFFYLTLIPVLWTKKINFKALYCLLVLILIPSILISSNYILPLLSSVAENRGEIYQASLITFIIYSCYQLINTFFIYLFYITSQKKSVCINEFKIIYGINIMLLLLLILYMILPISIRIFRNIVMLNIAYMLNLVCKVKYPSYLIAIICIILLILIRNFILPVWDDTIYSLFQYNLIF